MLPEMHIVEPLVSLCAAAVTLLACLTMGRIVVRAWAKECDWATTFLTGSACLSIAMLGLSLARLVAWATPLCVITLAAWRFGAPLRKVPSLPWWVRVIVVVYGGIYLVHALAPEVSADGSGYHLGFVRLYFERGAMFPDPSMYAGFPQGLEMLFVITYGIAHQMGADAVGAGSAAALVHLGFLAALVSLLFDLGRRTGAIQTGYAAGLIILSSPVVGIDAASANNDVAVAAAAMGAFAYATCGLWGPAGLLAGFAFGMKYTAGAVIVWLVGYCLWRARDARVLAVVSACVALTAAPWLARNWVWQQNPLAPFFNRYFPSGHQYVSTEERYRANMAHFGGAAIDAAWPADVTIRGNRVQAATGIAFLLTPVVLLTISQPMGATALSAAAVLVAAYPMNLIARFLIPALPFLAWGIALALSRRRWLLGTWVAVAVIAGLPFVALHGGWRLREIPWRAAARIEAPDTYIPNHLGDTYLLAKLIERTVPANGLVYTALPLPDAYAGRQIILNYTSAVGNRLYDTLYAAVGSKERVQISVEPGRLLCNSCGSEGRIYEAPAGIVFANSFDGPFTGDGNPATFWSPWGAGATEMELKAAGEVVASPGDWTLNNLAVHTQPVSQPIPAERVLDAFRSEGITHMVIHDEEAAGPWMRQRATALGLVELGKAGLASLYRLP